ncbi:MAG TPA: CDP-alcohol phosphatidyltransferase family protein [Methyloceanibacter sp.]|nr:CDP-alcohol phosphatidyltransferase family protein [Methyloceanibacter sp.]
MTVRFGAALVHLLTASGAVLALLALRAVQQHDWQMMFVWLGLALIVDTVDGPLARRLKVATLLPRFSGERLDLIVDYLTYVVVPAYALTEAPLLPEATRLPAAAAILLSSLFHVADLNSKTEEGYFVGFPAIWNIVVLYLFALGLSPFASLVVVSGFVLLTFVPLFAVHPFRVSRLRPLTCVMTALWTAAAMAAVLNPFPSPLLIQLLLITTAAYLSAIGFYRVFRGDPG